MSTDPEDIIAAAIADVTGDRPEVWTAEAAHTAARLRSAGLLAAPGTWSLPHEPGPEVTTVRCDCHGLRWRLVYAPPVSAWVPETDPMAPHPLPWRQLFVDHISVTDATGEPT